MVVAWISIFRIRSWVKRDQRESESLQLSEKGTINGIMKQSILKYYFSQVQET